MKPPAPLVSVACVLRCAAPDVEALSHISRVVSSFLDVSMLVSLENAATSSSIRLFHRVLAGLQARVPPIDEFLFESYLSKAIVAAVKGGYLAIVKHIHQIHPGKLDVHLLPLAMENGDIPMVQWLLENRHDHRCVPHPHDRDKAIQVLEDPPRCCLAGIYRNTATREQFGVIRWLEANGYHGPQYYLRDVGDKAAGLGDLEMVKWVHQRNPYRAFSTVAIDDAASAGHMQVVAFLLASRSEGYTTMAQHNATIGGHGEIVELLQSPTNQHLLRGAPASRDSWVSAAAKASRFDLVLRDLQAIGLAQFNMQFVIEHAYSKGCLDFVKAIAQTDPEALNDPSLRYAARPGHLHILQWVHDQGVDAERFNSSVVDTAAACGHLDVIQWLHQHYSGAFTPRAMHHAAVNGHLHIVQWLYDHRKEGCTMDAMDITAKAGHLHVLQWLHAHRIEGCTTLAMDEAAVNGHHDVVKWLHANRTEGCTTAAMDGAARNGDLELVIWLHEHRTEGCTTVGMDESPLYVAKWLHFNRTEGCTDHAMDRAARMGDLTKIQFLHANRNEGCSEDGGMNAAISGHLYILQWLRHHRPRDFDLKQTRELAESYNHAHIIDWLESLRDVHVDG